MLEGRQSVREEVGRLGNTGPCALGWTITSPSLRGGLEGMLQDFNVALAWEVEKLEDPAGAQLSPRLTH